MIKQIQLKGISRTPSDRMSADGRCAESLNVIIDEGGEIAPVAEAVDITSNAGTLDKVVFVHHVGSGRNYMTISVNNVIKATIDKTEQEDFSIALGTETFGSASSLGNVVMIMTDKHVHYASYRDGKYVYLGTCPPEAKVKLGIETKDVETVRKKHEEFEVKSLVWLNLNLLGNIVHDETRGIDGAVSEFNEWVSKYYTSETMEDESYTYREVLDAFSSALWELANNAVSEQRSAGYEVYPRLIRHSMKLSDGTQFHQSCPVLVGDNGCSQQVTLSAEVPEDGDRQLVVAFAGAHKVSFAARMDGAEKWKDYYQEVDVWSSTAIMNPKPNTRIIRAEAVGDTVMRFVFDGQESYDNPKDFKESLLDTSLFYKIGSEVSEEISDEYEESEGETVYRKTDSVSQDELVTRESLDDDENSHHSYCPLSSMYGFNQRTIWSGIGSVLYRGYPMQMSFHDFNSANDETYNIEYLIRTDDGDTKRVYCHGDDGTKDLAFHKYGCWAYYPDTRCYMMRIVRNSYAIEVAMKPHPLLNGAYAFADPSTGLDDGTGSYYYTEDDSEAVDTQGNRLFMSRVDNPFSFALVNKLSFTADVIATSTVTKALSEGQHGDYPLYAFAKDGIWAIKLTDSGDFASVPSAVTRDVAVSAMSIAQIDDAIVFVTESGVRMLTGSDVKDISGDMLGRHFSLSGDNDLDSEALDAMTEMPEGRSALVSADDGLNFIGFMKGSACAYDYLGSRLIFFNNDRYYAYILSIPSLTWHKMNTQFYYSGAERKISDILVLSDYPNCVISGFVSWRVQSTYFTSNRLLELTTERDTSAVGRIQPGVIITRAIDLDNDNVRKQIRELKLRGHYEKGHVKYLLMASNDGLKYRLIHSLKGCSYNLFRLVILLNLSADERLSYIDVDYETRFTDKVR